MALKDSAAPPAASGGALPDSAAGRQLNWVLQSINGRVPVAEDEIRAHFTESFLAQAPPAQLKQVIAGFGPQAPLELVEVQGTGDPMVVVVKGVSTAFQVRISVADDSSAIRALLFSPYDLSRLPASFAEFETEVQKLAPNAAFLAAEIVDDKCVPRHALHAEQPLAIGSAFKLYVLLALADAVAAHELEWNTPLELRDTWKSLPSGRMQDEPGGKSFPILGFAEHMIAISDNTAADHLLYRLGREKVEAALRASGHAAPQLDVPFISTRELFWLKIGPGGDELPGYLALDPAARRSYLDEKVAGRRPELANALDWREPRAIDTFEWFASPTDLCGVLSALAVRGRSAGTEPVLQVLSRNPGAPVDAARWPFVGFKGGSEPGVLNASWLLRRDDGRWFAAVVTWNDTRAALNEAKAIRMASAFMSLLAAEP